MAKKLPRRKTLAESVEDALRKAVDNCPEVRAEPDEREIVESVLDALWSYRSGWVMRRDELIAAETRDE